MEIFNRVLIRFMQAFVLVFFTFVVSGYLGLVLLLPLGGFYHLISLLSGALGFNGIIAALIIGPSLAYGLYRAREIDGFYSRIFATGMDLFQLGKAQLCAYETMLKTTQPAPSENKPAQA